MKQVLAFDKQDPDKIPKGFEKFFKKGDKESTDKNKEKKSENKKKEEEKIEEEAAEDKK